MKKKKRITEQLESSEEAVGQLYPVLIDAETSEILDGRERRLANPEWRTETVEISGKTEKEKTINRLRIKHLSNWARKNIDKTEVLTEIAEATGWRGLKPFADFLGLSNLMEISRYLPQKYKDDFQSERAKTKRIPANQMLAETAQKATTTLSETTKAVLSAPMAEEKKADIVASIKTTQQKISDAIEELEPETVTPKEEIENWLSVIDIDPSLWGCLNARPNGFGDKTFHGNCSPTVIAAALSKWSSLDDKLILDPMAGSGTFIDVARAMGYSDKQILACDIRSIRNDIKSGDAANTKLADNSVDFIFTHFPYWKMIEYSDETGDLSRLSIEDFLQKSENIMIEMKRILRPGRFFIVMIGNIRKQGIIDLEAKLSIIGSKHFTLWDKIIKKIRTWEQHTRGQRMGLAVARARQHGYSITNHDTLLVFRKEGTP